MAVAANERQLDGENVVMNEGGQDSWLFTRRFRLSRKRKRDPIEQ